MARPPRFRINALSDLIDGLRFAPPERRHQQIEAAIALIASIGAQDFIPEDEIVHRITGYRPEMEEPTAFVGWMLQTDLTVFVERLSRSLQARVEDFPHEKPLTATMVCEQLGISATTLHRYRKQGLIAHQAVWPDGKCRITFFSDLLDQFVAGRSEAVKRARKFSRISPKTRTRMFKRARRYHESLGFSLNEAASRLAPRFGRSLEGVRKLLSHHDGAHPEDPIFTRHREPVDQRTQRFLLRASEFGVPVVRLAAGVGKSRSSVYRIISEARAQRLKDWSIEPIDLPTLAIEDAGEVLLSPPCVNEKLHPDPSLDGELFEWHRAVEAAEAPDPETESHWFGALNFLLHAVKTKRSDLDPYHPRAHDLDLLETYLRWACRLKWRIMSAYLRPALMTIQIHLGQPLTDRSAGDIRRQHARMISILSQSVDRFDPTGRVGFEGAMTFNLKRLFAALPEAPPGTGARAKHLEGALVLKASLEGVYPWAGLVGRLDRFRPLEALLEPQVGEILARRAGWGGGRPMTHLEVSQGLRVAPEQVSRIEQRAIRRCRQMASEARRMG